MFGALIGLGASLYGAKKSSSAAKRAGNQAAASEAANLDFAKEQYEDWKSIYGGLEENLSKYYNSLSPDAVAVRGLETFELEKDRALTTLRENLAQRGIGDSGLAGQAEIDMAMLSASERAKIRAEAPMKTAQQQADFLSLGLGQNPRSTVQNVLGTNANSAQNRANQAASFAGDATANALGGVGTTVTAVADYISSNDLFKRSTPGALPVAPPNVDARNYTDTNTGTV